MHGQQQNIRKRGIYSHIFIQISLDASKWIENHILLLLLSSSLSSSLSARISMLDYLASDVREHNLICFRRIAKSNNWLYHVCQSFCLPVCLSVRPSVLPHAPTRFPLEGFSWNLIFEYFFRKSAEKIQVWLKSDKKRCMKTFVYLWHYLAEFFLKWEIFQTNLWRKPKQIFCWIKRDQPDATYFIITLFSAQHVSDVNTSILRSLRLIRWVTSWVVSDSMCVGVTLQCGCGGVVSVCRLKHFSTSATLQRNTNTHRIRYNPWSNSTN